MGLSAMPSKIEIQKKVELKKEKKVEIEEEEELPEWMWDEERSSLPVRQLVFTEEKVVVRVYALARALSSAFSQHGVPFWTSGGTTLGIVRHGGLIPWDDDLDICLREQDEHLLEKGQLAKTLESVGCRVARAKDYSWKVWLEDQSDDIVSIGGKTESYRFPFCDIFIMCKKKGRYELRGKQGRSAWPEEWYTVHQVEAAFPAAFGDVELPCPLDPHLYLDRTYGVDWNEIGSTHQFCYRTGAVLSTTTFPISCSATFQPALPFR